MRVTWRGPDFPGAHSHLTHSHNSGGLQVQCSFHKLVWDDRPPPSGCSPGPPAAPAQARTACPLLGGAVPAPMASGSQIRPLSLAISRKQLGRTGSHCAGQPRPPPRWPIRGQIFWEPLYKPQPGSQLFPGKRRASRSPAAAGPVAAGTGTWERRAGQRAGAPARAQADRSVPTQPLAC